MLVLLAFLLVALLTLVTFVQTLYLESMRLLKKEYPALETFKAQFEEQLGDNVEHTALAVSLLKHSLLVASGVLFVFWSVSPWPALEGFLLGFFVLILAGYILPQMLYRRTDGDWLATYIPLLRLLILLFQPLVAILDWLGRLFELSNGRREDESTQDAEDNIDALLEAGEETGILEKEDSRLIQQVVKFGDKQVHQVMTPRHRIVAVPVNSSLEDLRTLVINEQYSRIPVYENTIDKIIGFVHVRDLFEMEASELAGSSIRSILRNIHGVPESMKASLLFRNMQASGTHIVYVVDEYGNTTGIATMEDVVEEIVGEIRDEHEPTDDVKTAADGSVVVSGSYDLDHIPLLFHRRIEDVEATTVGGLVMEWMGKVPAPGDIVEREGLRFEVLAANGNRVERVRIRNLAPGDSP